MNFFRFYSNFRKFRLPRNLWVVFVHRFDRLARNFLNIVRDLSANTYLNFVIFKRFLENKNQNLKKFEKIHTYSDKLTNQFWLKKKIGYQFLC